MPMHRKNKAPAARKDNQNEQWFLENTKRQRKRREMAAASRKRNRK